MGSFESASDEAQLAALAKPAVFKDDDFTGVTPLSFGGERTVYQATIRTTGEQVVIKEPTLGRRLATYIMTRREAVYAPYAHLDGDRIDLPATVADERVKALYNADQEDLFAMAQVAHIICPHVAKPIGLKEGPDGYLGEAYSFYKGKMAQDTGNPAESHPLTDEQWNFFQGQVARLRSHGLRSWGDELQINNVMRTGDGPEDIVFLEPPTQFDQNIATVDDGVTKELQKIWDRFEARKG